MSPSRLYMLMDRCDVRAPIVYLSMHHVSFCIPCSVLVSCTDHVFSVERRSSIVCTISNSQLWHGMIECWQNKLYNRWRTVPIQLYSRLPGCQWRPQLQNPPVLSQVTCRCPFRVPGLIQKNLIKRETYSLLWPY